MPTIEYKKLSSALDRHYALIEWARDNLGQGSNVRFNGSRSNRIRGQYRQVLQVDYDGGLYFMFSGKDPVIGKFETGSIKTAIVVSKNTYKGADPNYIGVVASNSLESLQSIEIDGEWKSISTLLNTTVVRPKICVYITPPDIVFLPRDQCKQIFI